MEEGVKKGRNAFTLVGGNAYVDPKEKRISCDDLQQVRRRAEGGPSPVVPEGVEAAAHREVGSLVTVSVFRQIAPTSGERAWRDWNGRADRTVGGDHSRSTAERQVEQLVRGAR